MKPPIIALSHVSDGSMRDRNDPTSETVFQNRDRWLKAISIDPTHTTRVRLTYTTDDFCRYSIIDQSSMGEGMYDEHTPPADALVTTTPGHALFLPVADCIAAVLYDSKHGVLMLSHLGRHSLEQNGGVRSVEFLQQKFETKPEDLFVFLSPSVNKEVYPIHKLGGTGMKEAVHEQLKNAGVPSANIYDDTADTATDPTLFSYSESLKGNKPSDGCHAVVAQLPN